MSEERKGVDVELTTEFDRALSKYTKRLFVGVVALVLTFFLVEFVLIFFLLSDQSVLKLQTANGAIVGGTGLAIIAFSSAYFLWPTKLMGWEALKITRAMRDESGEAVKEMKTAAANMNDFVVKANSMLAGGHLQDIKASFELRMDLLVKKLDDIGGNDPVVPLTPDEEAKVLAKLGRK
jgi:hypothetical protein